MNLLIRVYAIYDNIQMQIQRNVKFNKSCVELQFIANSNIFFIIKTPFMIFICINFIYTKIAT